MNSTKNLSSDFFINTVDNLCSRYGNVGLAAGILEDGETTSMNFGTSDGAQGHPTTKDTIFLISSMTKPIIALALAIMAVDTSYPVDFTTPVKEIFPELSSKTFLRHAGRELTVADLLDNRTEFMRFTNLWESPNGDVPWKTIGPILALLRHLPPSDKYKNGQDFVHARNYSNEGFALAAAVLEKTTKMSWAKFVRQHILQPLGMSNTFAGITKDEERQASGQMAKSFSVSVHQSMKEIQKVRDQVGYWKFDYRVVYDYVQRQLARTESLPIRPSQASRTEPDLEASPIGAAAGIMSTVSDLLKFYNKFIEIYHLPDYRKSQLDQLDLGHLERGMLLVQSHIEQMMHGGTCAYAAGWSTTMLPWDSKQTSVKPRWPGADGDNAKRLEKVMQELDIDDNIWPFFLRHEDCPQEPRLVLSHGGNMIGATSFCMVDLKQRRAVVVLSNTRGYLVDVANFVGLLISCSGEPTFQDQCDWVKTLTNHIAASYLLDTYNYEESLREGFPRLADTTVFKACIGRYQLTDCIFATVSPGHSTSASNKSGQTDAPPEPCLVFQLYGTGYSYPLRVSRDATDEGMTIKMTFASSMRELLPTGVGGTNRLTVDDFVLDFRRREQGRFQEFVWVFDRGGGKSADPSVFAFRRVVESGSGDSEDCQ